MAHSTFTQDLADDICGYIAEGKSVRALCREKGMPNQSTIFRWLRKHGEFREQYVHAREARATARFESISNTLEDLRNGDIDHHIARVEIDAVKWQLGRENAKLYGDRIMHAGDQENPITTRDVSESDTQALARFLANHADRVKPIEEG